MTLNLGHPYMKLVLAGGSGQVGAVLARAAMARGDSVTVLARRVGPARPWAQVAWDGRTPGAWIDALEDADVVINLAGRNVNCRYTAANRAAILASRVDSTRAIGAAIAAARRPPRVWLQASTATIYAHEYHIANDEATGRIGGGEPGAPDTWRFSIEVAQQWERAATEANLCRTRLVLLRSAMTMTPDRGGVFDVLLRLVRWGLGGTAGDGSQYISWIHEFDFAAAVFWLIANDSFDGAVNVCSPAPLPNRDFMRALREAWGSRLGLPAPRALLELATILMRTETELILKSRRVVPRRLSESGFRLAFPEWPAAAAELCARWRAQR